MTSKWFCVSLVFTIPSLLRNISSAIFCDMCLVIRQKTADTTASHCHCAYTWKTLPCSPHRGWLDTNLYCAAKVSIYFHFAFTFKDCSIFRPLFPKHTKNTRRASASNMWFPLFHWFDLFSYQWWSWSWVIMIRFHHHLTCIESKLRHSV